MMWCGLVWFGLVWIGFLWCALMRCGLVWYGTVLSFSTMLLYGTILGRHCMVPSWCDMVPPTLPDVVPSSCSAMQ